MSQGRVGDPHRGGRDGARTVADGCVDTPAMLVQVALLSPHARVADMTKENSKMEKRKQLEGRGREPAIGPLARWAQKRSGNRDLWLSVHQWQHAGHRGIV